MAGGHNASKHRRFLLKKPDAEDQLLASYARRINHCLDEAHLSHVHNHGSSVWLKNVAPRISGGHRVLDGIGMGCLTWAQHPAGNQ